MLIRGPISGISGQEGHQLVQKGPNNAGVMHDLNSDLSKLVINIPFSHKEDDEDIFVEDPAETDQESTECKQQSGFQCIKEVAIFEFLELGWILILKAVSDLDWKNITRPKLENGF